MWMKKHLAPLLLTVLLAAGFASGCGRSELPEPSASAPQEEKLVVYSPHPLSLITPLLTEFERETDIHAEVIRGGSGELMDKLEAEKEHPVCDVLWGGMLSTVSHRNYLFEDCLCSNDEAFQPEFRHAAAGATLFSDLPAVIMVNQEKYQGPAIQGYADLLAPELKGHIAMGDPAKSSAAYAHLMSMLYGMGGGDPEAGWGYVEAFCAQIDGKLISSSLDVYKSVADTGPYSVALTFEEAAVKCVSDGAPVYTCYMQEGVVSDQDVISIVKGTQKREKAEKLLSFLTSHSTQKMLAEHLYRRPVRADVDLSPTYHLKPKAELPLLQQDRQLVSQNRQAWIERFHSLCQKYRQK